MRRLHYMWLDRQEYLAEPTGEGMVDALVNLYLGF